MGLMAEVAPASASAPAVPADSSESRGRGPKRSAGVHSQRVIFIDFTRAMAVVFMLYGHAVDALLAPGHREGLVYGAWQFQRGLTSCLFLTLSGFAFSIATSRHWTSHLAFSPSLLKRLRRFGLFVLLGYSLHLPTRLSRLMIATDAQLLNLYAVDVLQVIGVTFIAVQGLVMLVRSQRLFARAAILLAAAAVLLAPAAWQVDWTRFLHPAAAAYLTSTSGSLFPLLPWGAFILLGAALGQLYAHRGASALPSYATWVLIVPGACIAAVSWLLRHYQHELFGAPFGYVPGDMFLRAGTCLVILGCVAHLTRHLTRLPHVFGAVAQESLVVYFVHLLVVYGSIWNHGLTHWFALSLSPVQVLPIVLALIAAMVLLAWQWNWWKHAHPRVARGVAVAVWTLLIYRVV